MIHVHVCAIHENSFTNTCTVGISLQSSEWIKWHRDFLPKFLNTFVLSTFIVPIKVVRVVQMRHTCTIITMYMYVCCMKPYKIKGSECQYMIYCTANISHIALWLLTRRATANTISPPPYCMYSVLKEPGTTAKASHKFSVQLHSAYLVC